MTETGAVVASLSDFATPRRPNTSSFWLSPSKGNSPLSVVALEVARLAGTRERPTRILDLGFGTGAHWEGVSPPPSVHLTAVDASTTWVGATVSPVPSDVLIGIVPEALKGIPSGSYDIVMAFDLIEHLPKHQGYLLVYEMQRISRSMAVVFTPNGHVWQPPSSDNEWNAHISGWTPKEFRGLGWAELRGWTGMRHLIGPYGAPRMHPRTGTGRMAVGALTIASKAALAVPSLSFAFTAAVRPGTGHRPYPADAWGLAPDGGQVV